MDLSLANVINISVATPQPGVGQFNTSNLSIFTREVPAASFGSLGYKIYLEPTEVAVDFGTDSDTFREATAVFSQQPNILSGGGYLVVIPMLATPQTAVQEITFPTVPVSGTFELDYNGNNTGTLNWNDDAATIEAELQGLAGLGSATVSGAIPTESTPNDSLVVTFTGVVGPAVLLLVEANTLVDADTNAVVPVVETTTIGSTEETLDKAIIRTVGLVQYFGVMTTEIEAEDVMLAAAAVIQSVRKIAFFLSITAADVDPGGKLDKLRTGSFTQSRGIFYGDTEETGLVFMAAYAGLGLSTNFNGSLTTQTMHLKTLSGVQPDPSMTQTLLNLCQAAGADVYASLQGVSKTFTSGANDYYDNQYNLQWFAATLEVSGFNALATTNTKIPQTEGGMDILKGAYRTVCEQAVTNGFSAPGSWTSPVTFGDLADLIANVSQRGYYIFSSPVAQQLPAVRAARQAPLVQIALKYAGAIHSSTVIVNVNP